VKTPLPLLLMTAAGLLLWMRRGKDGLDPLQALLPQVPLLVYLFAFTLSGNLKNIGLRYILPVYPFMCIVAAMTTRVDFNKLWRSRLIYAMVAWQACIAAWMYPDYLTFFNLTVGGPSRGAEVLLDSTRSTWIISAVPVFATTECEPPPISKAATSRCRRQTSRESTPKTKTGTGFSGARHRQPSSAAPSSSTTRRARRTGSRKPPRQGTE
jgi:hypothetical protein